MKKYIGNAFSLQMLETDCLVSFEQIDEKEFNSFKEEAISCVGHEDTANLLAVEFNRCNISLEKGDVLVVAQVTGGRLPVGCVELPSNMSFRFIRCVIK